MVPFEVYVRVTSEVTHQTIIGDFKDVSTDINCPVFEQNMAYDSVQPPCSHTPRVKTLVLQVPVVISDSVI